MAGTKTRAAAKTEGIVPHLKNSAVRRISSPAGRNPGRGNFAMRCDDSVPLRFVLAMKW